MDQWTARLAPQLRALAELATHAGHMTEAAAALGVPQSSMSRRIHALEEALQVPLLVQDGRIVRLTPAAVALAESVRQPLREIDAVLEAAAGEGDSETGTVRFGFPLTMGSGRVPDLLADFRRHHPGVRLHLKQAHGAALTDDLRDGLLDLAIVIPPPEATRHAVLGTQQIHAILPDWHRLADRPQLELDELRGEAFIANPPSYDLRRLTERWCEANGFTPDITVEITEFATVRELVERGLGIALLPPDERQTPGLVEIPLAGGYRREIALTWPTAAQSPITRRLSDFILENFE